IMGANHQLTLMSSEINIGRTMDEGCLHYRTGLAVPLHRDRAIAVVFQVRLKRRISGMTNGYAIKHVAVGFGDTVGVFLIGGAQAVGNSQDSCATLADAG